MKRQRGAALILALWALALLSVMMGAVVQSIRLENRQSTYELQHAKALLAAQAGLALAIQSLASPPSTMIADGRAYSLPFDDAQLTVKAYSDRGKLDLNFANLDNFIRLATFLGASPAQSQQLTDEMSLRRANANTLKAIEELQQFPGMDPTLYERLAPHLTLWTGLGQPDPSFAAETVRAALKLGPPVPGRSPGTILTVHSQAILATGVSADLDVTFFLTPQGEGTQLYRVLRWQE
ncbi:hypothetical protein ACW9IK_19820 [Pseudomonas gingeri]